MSIILFYHDNRCANNITTPQEAVQWAITASPVDIGKRGLEKREHSSHSWCTPFHPAELMDLQGEEGVYL